MAASGKKVPMDVDAKTIADIHDKIIYLQKRFRKDIFDETLSKKGLSLDEKQLPDRKVDDLALIEFAKKNLVVPNDKDDKQKTAARVYISRTVIKLEAVRQILDVIGNVEISNTDKLNYMKAVMTGTELSDNYQKITLKDILLEKRGKSHGVSGIANKNATTIILEIGKLLDERMKHQTTAVNEAFLAGIALEKQAQLNESKERYIKAIKVLPEIITLGMGYIKQNNTIKKQIMDKVIKSLKEAKSKEPFDSKHIVNLINTDAKRYSVEAKALKLLDRQNTYMEKILAPLQFIVKHKRHDLALLNLLYFIPLLNLPSPEVDQKKCLELFAETVDDKFFTMTEKIQNKFSSSVTERMLKSLEFITKAEPPFLEREKIAEVYLSIKEDYPDKSAFLMMLKVLNTTNTDEVIEAAALSHHQPEPIVAPVPDHKVGYNSDDDGHAQAFKPQPAHSVSNEEKQDTSEKDTIKLPKIK